MKILFVDDEPLILEGLQNLLRRFRKKWAMSFAVGADEALEKLDIETFDIVITDMRMPGLSGAELLKRVRETHPGTARIMLSGYSEEETILQALPVAHQY
ncbi:MAG: response regulator, partial [Deltaproteobacteria bacterium]|nr:response regulator [Deltaproteobacteria bacterium]